MTKSKLKTKRQGLRISIDELRRVANELEEELMEQSKELNIEMSTSQGCILNIINKEPECSDTWEIENFEGEIKK